MFISSHCMLSKELIVYIVDFFYAQFPIFPSVICSNHCTSVRQIIYHLVGKKYRTQAPFFFVWNSCIPKVAYMIFKSKYNYFSVPADFVLWDFFQLCVGSHLL